MYTCILEVCIFIFSRVKSRMATGYDSKGNKALTYDLGWVAPAGQMYSTVNDLMKVMMCNCLYAMHDGYYMDKKDLSGI